ncbi:hypothetical protein DFH06DRAFT_1149006 [Mycena polygramma]|nr:hypothetical protein DFH06DRAFT_1149006 [Mycena polygramma]
MDTDIPRAGYTVTFPGKPKQGDWIAGQAPPSSGAWEVVRQKDAPNRHGDIVWQTKAGRLDRGEHTPSEAREVRARKESKKKKTYHEQSEAPNRHGDIVWQTKAGRPFARHDSVRSTRQWSADSAKTASSRRHSIGGSPERASDGGLEANRKDGLEGRFTVALRDADQHGQTRSFVPPNAFIIYRHAQRLAESVPGILLQASPTQKKKKKNRQRPNRSPDVAVPSLASHGCLDVEFLTKFGYLKFDKLLFQITKRGS